MPRLLWFELRDRLRRTALSGDLENASVRAEDDGVSAVPGAARESRYLRNFLRPAAGRIDSFQAASDNEGK